MLLLPARTQGAQHAAEVLPHKLDDELLACEGLPEGHEFGGGDLVEEVSAGCKGKFLREDEGVVAVKEEGCDLRSWMLAGCYCWLRSGVGTSLGHFGDEGEFGLERFQKLVSNRIVRVVVRRTDYNRFNRPVDSSTDIDTDRTRRTTTSHCRQGRNEIDQSHYISTF